MSTPLWLFSKGRVSHLFITLHVNCKVASSIATGQVAGLSDSPEAPGDLWANYHQCSNHHRVGKTLLLKDPKFALVQ